MRRSAARFALLFSAVTMMLAPPPAFGDNLYGWTISHSSTDPFVGAAPAAGTIAVLYLHYACNDGDGVSAAEFGIVSPDGGTVLAFNPLNGFLNAGSSVNLLLAVASCPAAPMLAGQILVTPGFSYAVAPDSAGVNGTVDCDANPLLWEPNASVNLGPNGGESGDITCTPAIAERKRSRPWVRPR